VKGLKELMAEHDVRIRNGMVAYGLLEKLRAGDNTPENVKGFEK